MGFKSRVNSIDNNDNCSYSSYNEKYTPLNTNPESNYREYINNNSINNYNNNNNMRKRNKNNEIKSIVNYSSDVDFDRFDSKFLSNKNIKDLSSNSSNNIKNIFDINKDIKSQQYSNTHKENSINQSPYNENNKNTNIKNLEYSYKDIANLGRFNSNNEVARNYYDSDIFQKSMNYSNADAINSNYQNTLNKIEVNRVKQDRNNISSNCNRCFSKDVTYLCLSCIDNLNTFCEKCDKDLHNKTDLFKNHTRISVKGKINFDDSNHTDKEYDNYIRESRFYNTDNTNKLENTNNTCSEKNKYTNFESLHNYYKMDNNNLLNKDSKKEFNKKAKEDDNSRYNDFDLNNKDKNLYSKLNMTTATSNNNLSSANTAPSFSYYKEKLNSKANNKENSSFNSNNTNENKGDTDSYTRLEHSFLIDKISQDFNEIESYVNKKTKDIKDKVLLYFNIKREKEKYREELNKNFAYLLQDISSTKNNVIDLISNNNKNLKLLIKEKEEEDYNDTNDNFTNNRINKTSLLTGNTLNDINNINNLNNLNINKNTTTYENSNSNFSLEVCHKILKQTFNMLIEDQTEKLKYDFLSYKEIKDKVIGTIDELKNDVKSVKANNDVLKNYVGELENEIAIQERHKNKINNDFKYSYNKINELLCENKQRVEDNVSLYNYLS